MEVLDGTGRSPLELAAQYGHLELVEYLTLIHGCSDAARIRAKTMVPRGAASFWITRCLEEGVGCSEQAPADSRICGPIQGGCGLPLSSRCFRGPEQVHVDARQLSLFTGSLSIVVSFFYLVAPSFYDSAVHPACQRGLAAIALLCNLLGWPCFLRASRTPTGADCDRRRCRYKDALDRAAAVTADDSREQICNWWQEREPLIHQLAMVGPMRSKYCSATRRCILVYDHYCSFLRKPVGQSNYAAFAWTVTLATITCSCLVAIALLPRRESHEDLLSVCVSAYFGTFVVSGLTLISIQLLLACRGLTMNEFIQIARGRTPAYLIDESSGLYLNPFDTGLLRNLIRRLHPDDCDR